MKETLTVIAKALVDAPDDVVVVEREGENNEVVLELSVAQDDMGKVIGRQGRIAKAIRTVIRAAATREDKKVTVDIV